MITRVLLVGESWASAATHYKGFDQFGSVTFHLGAEPLVAVLKGTEFELNYMKAHEAAEGFPFEMAGLDAYDVVILSDIGSNTFLLPPAVWLRSETVPNRLRLLKAWVEKGGALLMCGGTSRSRESTAVPAGAELRSRTRCPSPACPGTTASRCARARCLKCSGPTIRCWRGSPAPGPWCSASTRSRCATPPASRCSPASPRRKGASAPRDRAPWSRAHRRLDLGHRAALAVARLLRLGGLRPALD